MLNETFIKFALIDERKVPVLDYFHVLSQHDKVDDTSELAEFIKTQNGFFVFFQHSLESKLPILRQSRA